MPFLFPPNGSGVFFGSRFFRYSASLAIRGKLAGLLAALPRRLLLRLLLPRALDRLAQSGHQVDDLCILLFLRLRELLPLRLLADQLQELLAVVVVVLVRLERIAQVLHERLRHLDLAVREFSLPVHGLRLPDLVRVVHRLEDQNTVVGAKRGEVLLVPDHDLGDADLPCLFERLHEQPVRLLGALLRCEVIGLAKVDRVEIVVLERDVAALVDLEAAHDLVGGNGLAAVLAHLVVADRRQVTPVEEVKAQLFRLGRREHPHSDADEAERDRATPDGSGHGTLIPSLLLPKPVVSYLRTGSTCVDKAVEAVDSENTPSVRNRRRRALRSSSPGIRCRSSTELCSASPSRRAASSGSSCAPPGGSGTTASITPSWRQLAASGLRAAAALTFSPASRQRIAAQPSGEITVYIAFSCMSTRSASAVAIAPPEPPSPMMHATTGIVRRLISAWERAIAPPCPCCSAATPG